MVEAAGIELVQTQNPNPMVVYDFGFYDMTTMNCSFSRM
jgi:hypothetical protein